MSGQKIYNTPLIKKIGITPNKHVLLIQAPVFIRDYLKSEACRFDTTSKPQIRYDIIWIFVNSIPRFESDLEKYKSSIVSNGVIWISWYKKASGLSTELNEDIIRDTALTIGLVDIKVASIDMNWSALKLVIPLKHRQA